MRGIPVRLRPIPQGIRPRFGWIRPGSTMLRRGQGRIPADSNRLPPVLPAFQGFVGRLRSSWMRFSRALCVGWPGVLDRSQPFQTRQSGRTPPPLWDGAQRWWRKAVCRINRETIEGRVVCWRGNCHLQFILPAYPSSGGRLRSADRRGRLAIGTSWTVASALFAVPWGPWWKGVFSAALVLELA